MHSGRILVSLFVTTQVLQADYYERFSFEPRRVNIRPLHVCDLVYPILMITKLIERLPQNNMDVFVMYDIACTLKKHVEVKELVLCIVIICVHIPE